jgi:hypothetical protein
MRKPQKRHLHETVPSISFSDEVQVNIRFLDGRDVVFEAHFQIAIQYSGEAWPLEETI